MSTATIISLYFYKPSYPLDIFFLVIYFALALWQGYQTFFKYKSWFFIPVFVGAVVEVAGYASRGYSIKNPAQILPYAMQSAFIILAPVFFGAGNYLIITRLCLRVLPSHVKTIYGIPCRHLTRIFISSDLICFLIQGGGSGIASIDNFTGPKAKIGNYALLGGLGIQLATFCFFVTIITRFDVLTRGGCVREDAGEGWKVVLRASYISSTLIIIRSIFRLVEFALGFDGYPSSHEWTFYCFEAIPMVPAIAVFCVWHPAAYFGGGNGKWDNKREDKEGFRLVDRSRETMLS